MKTPGTHTNFFAAILALALIVSAGGCGGDEAATPEASAETTAEADPGVGQEIKLLYSAPLTGDPTGSGRAGCDGATLAVEDINAAGGIEAGPLKGATLSIECVDDEFSTDIAATIASRYVADEDIWALMGFTTSGQAQAAGRVAAQAGLTVVGSNVSADFLTQDSDNIVAIAGRLAPIGAALTDFCHSYFGGTRLANVNPDFSYVDELVAGQREKAEELGVEVVVDQRYEFGTQNFSAQLTAVRAANPDCVYNADFPPIPQQILVQARELGIQAPFIDFCACGTAEAGLKVAGEQYVGYIISEQIPFEKEEGTRLADVAERWQNATGDRLRSYVAWSYDGVLAVAAAIAAGAESREELLDHFPEVDVEGLTTRLKFTEELRPQSYTLVLLEQTGTSIDDVEQVAHYTYTVDGTLERHFLAECASRPTCQSAG